MREERRRRGRTGEGFVEGKDFPDLRTKDRLKVSFSWNQLEEEVQGLPTASLEGRALILEGGVELDEAVETEK